MSDSDMSISEYSRDCYDKLEQVIVAIREALESVNTSDYEESFDDVCFCLKNLFDGLWELVLEDSGSDTDKLIKLAYGVLTNLNNLFGSMRQKQQEQKKFSLSRLLCYVTSQNPPLFSHEQIKQIESIIKSLESDSPLPSLGDTSKRNIENEDDEKTPTDLTEVETSSMDKGLLGGIKKQKKFENDLNVKTSKDGELKRPKKFAKMETSSLEGRDLLREKQNKIGDHDDKVKASTNFAKLETSSLKSRGLLRENNEQNKTGNDHEAKTSKDLTKVEISSLEGRELLGETTEQNKIVNDDKDRKEGNAMAIESEDVLLSYYQTDVLKGVSTYFHKFGNIYLNMHDLPSPTPSRNGEGIFDDIFKSVTAPMLPQLIVSPSCEMNMCSPQAWNGTKNTIPSKPFAKSKDPSLRFANADTVTSGVSIVDSVGGTEGLKKQNPTDELFSNGPTLKRQKIGLTETSTCSTSLLESILKEINVNPAVLKNLKEEEDNNSSSFSHNMEKFNFKPRDPRRALHCQTLEKVGKVGPNHITTSAPISSSEETKNLKNITNERGTISSYKEVSAAPSPSQNEFGDIEHLFKGLDDKQRAALHKEEASSLEEQKKMLAARKLCLVLDLDHTLLNSVKFSEVDPVHSEKLRRKEERDRKNPHRQLFSLPHIGMWTKLRPGIWNFLEKASKLFELHLCTLGNKMYATEMAKLLDPKGTLFCGPVISRGDDEVESYISKTKDLEGVLGMESCVVIIDDTVQVWQHYKLNLIAVERYIYFPWSRRQFGLSGPSLFEIDRDESQEAGTLASSLAVIERIHQHFFEHQSLEDIDVRNILASEQRKILAGCQIVFSRVFPVGEANPRQHHLWKTAEQFGAICTNVIDEKVTHVVANSLGTHKVKWAYSNRRFVVRPGWVEASALLYRRANEKDFSLTP